MRIAIAANTLIGLPFWKDLARYAKNLNDTYVSVICTDQSQVNKYRLYKDEFDEVEQILEYVDKHTGVLNLAELSSFAKRFEAETGTLITDILQCDRGAGVGYSLGGINHPESYRAKSASYWYSVYLIKKLTNDFDAFFLRARPDVLLLGGVASLLWKVACIRARVYGVSIRILFPARYKNRWLWAHNELMECPAIKKNFASLSGNEPSCVSKHGMTMKLDSYENEQRFRSEFSKDITLRGMLSKSARRAIMVFLQSLICRLKGLEPAANRYPLVNMIRYYFMAFRQAQEYEQYSISHTSDVGSIDYVYLPLSVEPEATLSVTSPEFNNQIALVDMAAKGLPSGVMLVVKEHIPAVGRRPRDFYRWLSTIPNVILAPLHANGARLARDSKLVITVAGTAGLEAAAAGVPVVTFGQHNMYNILPHVIACDSISEFRGILRSVLNVCKDSNIRRINGARLLEAIEMTSVDLGSFNPRQGQPLPKVIISELYSSLVTSLSESVIT